MSSTRYFYPRSPCGERRSGSQQPDGTTRNFYPRSPCGERLTSCSLRYWSRAISIHALLAESDRDIANSERQEHISIHALLAESDIINNVIDVINEIFLSTLSLRRATHAEPAEQAQSLISIHALLAESDRSYFLGSRVPVKFLSTLSLRRATARRALGFVDPDISIHALLAESDCASPFSIFWICHFYPRSPCGERRQSSAQSTPEEAYFYPRSPCGERR